VFSLQGARAELAGHKSCPRINSRFFGFFMSVEAGIFSFNMAKTKEQKKEIVQILEQNLDKQKVIYFVDFTKAKTSGLLNLRKSLKEKDAIIYMAKKNLIEIAFANKKMPVGVKDMNGQVALVFGFKDEISPAKTLWEFEEKNEFPAILGAYLGQEFLNKERVVELAKLPSKEELLARLINSLRSPAYGLAKALEYNLKGLIYLLNKVANQA